MGNSSSLSSAAAALVDEYVDGKKNKDSGSYRCRTADDSDYSDEEEIDEEQAQAQPPQQVQNGENDAAVRNDIDHNNDNLNDDMEDFGLLPLQNRPPWWNVELGSFVLNFGGRVSVASVKNFQLCHRNDQDNIMLQFGRIQGRHAFTMDFQHPLTAVQAFSIAISSLQSKISFG